MPEQLLIIGIGNIMRGDDGAGIAAARQLRIQYHTGVRILELAGEGAALIDAWQGTWQGAWAQRVILIDAVSSGAAPGTIFRLDAATQPIPVSFFNYSTHAFSLAEAVELARALGELPPHLIIYGIEGQDYAAGSNLSPAMARAIPELVQRIVQEIAMLAVSDAEILGLAG